MKRFTVIMLFVFSFSAWAARTIKLPIYSLYTVHGGRVNSSTPGCVSADMIGTEAMYQPNSGLRMANHIYHFSIRNIGDTAQTVSFNVGPETFLGGSYSGGANGESIVADILGPQKNSPAGTRGPVVIAPGTSFTYVFETHVGTMADHWIFQDSFGFMDGNGSLLSGSGCNNAIPAKNCVTLNSRLQLSIVVAEDSGALRAALFVTAHRCGGHKDHYISTPPTIDVLGGQAF